MSARLDQATWLKISILFLSVYYVVTYLDPSLLQYVSNTGTWGLGWAAETSQFVDPSWSSFFTPTKIRILIFVGVMAAIGLNSARFRLVCVVITLVLNAILLFRSPSFYVIHRPFIGIATAFLPFLARDREELHFKVRSIDWLWSIVAISFLASAVSKLQEPHWLAGTALAELQGFPLRSTMFKEMIQFRPLVVLMTYSVVAIELLVGLLGYFQRFQKACWWGLLVLHLGTLCFLQIYVATVPMLIFHMFLFDVRWLRRPRLKR